MASKYLRYDVLPPKGTRKTEEVVVSNIMNGLQIGFIGWYPPFRKYVFSPISNDGNLVFDAACLADISEKLQDMMQKHQP